MQRDKYLFLFISVLIIFLFSLSCKRKTTEIIIIPDALKNHLQSARFFGNVKNVETYTYYYSTQDSLYIFYGKTIQSYNSVGYLTQVVELDKNNDTVSKRACYFLPNGNENYWVEYNYKNISTTKDTLIYDKNGFKSEEYFLFNDSLLYKIQYKTDAIGSIIEMKRWFPDYHLTNKIYYNIHGLAARMEEYDPQNNLFKFVTIEYDKFGDELNRRAYNKRNTMIEYTYSQYNNERLLLKIIYEDRLHNQREDRIYTYHDNYGNWLEEIMLQGKDTVRKRARGIDYYELK